MTKQLCRYFARSKTTLSVCKETLHCVRYHYIIWMRHLIVGSKQNVKVLNIEYILYTQGHAFGKIVAIGSNSIIFIEYVSWGFCVRKINHFSHMQMFLYYLCVHIHISFSIGNFCVFAILFLNFWKINKSLNGCCDIGTSYEFKIQT